jgi:hypothetical protein
MVCILERLGVEISGDNPTDSRGDRTVLSVRKNFTDEDLQCIHLFHQPSRSDLSAADVLTIIIKELISQPQLGVTTTIEIASVTPINPTVAPSTQKKRGRRLFQDKYAWATGFKLLKTLRNRREMQQPHVREVLELGPDLELGPEGCFEVAVEQTRTRTSHTLVQKASYDLLVSENKRLRREVRIARSDSAGLRRRIRSFSCRRNVRVEKRRLELKCLKKKLQFTPVSSAKEISFTAESFTV